MVQSLNKTKIEILYNIYKDKAVECFLCYTTPNYEILRLSLPSFLDTDELDCWECSAITFNACTEDNLWIFDVRK